MLRSYVGDKLGIEGAALTPAEAETALVQAGVEPGVAAHCRAELERFEAAQYGVAAVSATAEAVAGGAGDGLSELIRTIDRQFRARRT